MTLLSGGTLYLQEGLEVDRFLGAIAAERINSTRVVPGQLYSLLDDPRFAAADLSSLRTLSVSGGPLAPARLTQAVRMVGPIIRVAYGTSECPMITAATGVRVDPTRPELLGSCGSPYGGVRLQDGWLRTGDIGRLDERGRLYIVDRVAADLPVGRP